VAVECPNCGEQNFNTASRCKKCNWSFSDSIKCPHCGEYNLKTWGKCVKCKKELFSSQNNYENKNNQRKENETNKETKIFECVVCRNKFSINVIDEYNAFVCKNCRSIYSYEWKNGKLLINVVKREETIPDNIKKLIEFFDLEFPIEQGKLKSSYHKKLSQYHPDKVSHLGKEFKELSEQKTKEIIENFEILHNWVKSINSPKTF
jgi:predicted RNA-binding Zn-ribbon protein involved in translation (DUF1610 family)